MSPFVVQHESRTGAPLVLLHGFLGRPAMWAPLLSSLEWPGPVALACLPGHGPAPWFPPAPSFSAAVDALARAWPFSRPAWVLGYSMGGRVALALALRHPSLLLGAALLGADLGLRDEAARAERRAWDEAQAAQLLALGLDAFSARWATLPIFSSQARLSPARLAPQEEQRREHTAAGAAWAMRVLGLGQMPSYWEDLSSATRPLCFLSGALDDKFSRIAAEAAGLAPNASRAVIPDAGHNAALEAPGALAAALRRFVSGGRTTQEEP